MGIEQYFVFLVQILYYFSHWKASVKQEELLRVKVLFKQSSLLISKSKCKFTSRFEMWIQRFAAIEDLDLAFIFKS